MGEQVSEPSGLAVPVLTPLLPGIPGRLKFLFYEGSQRYPSPGSTSTLDGHPGSQPHRECHWELPDLYSLKLGSLDPSSHHLLLNHTELSMSHPLSIPPFQFSRSSREVYLFHLHHESPVQLCFCQSFQWYFPICCSYPPDYQPCVSLTVHLHSGFGTMWRKRDTVV